MGGFKVSFQLLTIMIDFAKRSCLMHRHSAAIIDKRHRLICIGYNDYRGTRNDGHGKYSVHAEISALTHFPLRRDHLKDCVMVVIRIGKDSELKLSKPCVHCQKVIAKCGIRKIYFSG